MSRDVTVAIPAHGSPERVIALLRGLAEQAREGEPLAVIVSDDASPEPLAPALEAAALDGLNLRVVRSEVNGGPGAARNRALDAVETNWVAFMDADELASEDWLETFEQLAADPAGPEVIVGRVAIAGEPSPFQHATEESTEGEQYGAGNVAFRCEALRADGGFDERFYDSARRLHFREDAELHFRLEKAGRRVCFAPELVVEHPPLPSSFWGPARLARRYYFDALLSREHPELFRRHMRARRVGPISLRSARHDAALAYAGGLALTAGGVAARSRATARVGAVTLAAAWALNLVALSWKKRVRPRHLPGLSVLAGIVPLVYLWDFYRGVLAFRHHPRL